MLNLLVLAFLAILGLLFYEGPKENDERVYLDVNISSEIAIKRLPYDIKPINYNLTLYLDPRREYFEFDLVFNYKVQKETPFLIWHENAEQSEGVYRKRSPGENTTIVSGTRLFDAEKEGIFVYDLESQNGEKSLAIATQFESIFARKVFPCFDEPDRKATFEITLVIPSEYVGLSTMPVISNRTISTDSSLKHFNSSESYTELKFAKTPVMSTYTLAMAVGKFEYLERIYKQKIPIRIYTPIGKKIYGEFALNTTIRLLDFYTDLFGIEYPLPKLDIVTSKTTMENWGMINLLEPMLLSYPGQDNVKGLISATLAHELAHMWFGNLVTMKWWNDLWLNEGFGTWIGNYACEKLLSEYNPIEVYKMKYESQLYTGDSLEKTPPIKISIGKEEDIEQAFSETTYLKSAHIINMIFDHIGEEKFFSSIKVYLNKHLYSNAESKSLLKTFNNVTGQNIAQLIYEWIEKPGYPLVHVRKVGDRLIFNQTRFLFYNSTRKVQSSRWIIPLRIENTKEGSVIANITMPNDGKDFVLNCTESNIIVNPNRTAFIRVKYDKTLLDNLVQAMKEDKLNEFDTLAFIDDLLTFALTGHGNLVEAIDIVTQVKDHLKGLALDIITVHFSKIRNILSAYDLTEETRKKVLTNFDHLTISIISPMYRKLGWDFTQKDSRLDVIMRPDVIEALGMSGHKEVTEKAKVMFDKHYNASMYTNSTADLIHAKLQEAVFKIVVKNFGHEALVQLLKLHEATKNENEQVSIERGLLYASSAEDLNLLLKLIFDDSFADEKHEILINLAKTSPLAREVTWNYLKGMNEEFIKEVGGAIYASHTLGSMLRLYSGERFLNDATRFFEQPHFSCCRHEIDKGLELIRRENRVFSLVKQSLVEYLSR